MTTKSDITILGAGPGGYIGALAAASMGASVTLIEKDRVGGTCLHRGCIPTKTLLSTAHLAMEMAKSDTFAIRNKGFEVDFPALMKRKGDVVSRLENGILALLKKRQIRLVSGHGRVVEPDTILIESETGTQRIIAGKAVIIATGSTPARLPSVPFDGERIVTSDEALNFTKIPGSLCIIGAGVIGFEMAELFSALGTTVTMVEALPSVLATLDQDVSVEAARLLRRRKITAHTGVTAEKFDKSGTEIKIGLSNGKSVQAEKVLVVTGRRPSTEGVEIDAVGLKTEKNYIVADRVGRTNVENLFAVGDVTGTMMLAHFASAQCVAAVETILEGDSGFDPLAVPSVVYTSPEIASVGYTEAQAKKAGKDVKVAKFDVRALGRAQAEDGIIGFAKIIGDGKTGTLLGAHVFARAAGEIIHEAALAVRKKLSVKDLAETVHAHPSFAESVEEAAHLWIGKPRHA